MQCDDIRGDRYPSYLCEVTADVRLRDEEWGDRKFTAYSHEYAFCSFTLLWADIKIARSSCRMFSYRLRHAFNENFSTTAREKFVDFQ